MNSKTLRRFIEKAEVDESTGCWVWTGAVDGVGRGVKVIRGRKYTVHRLAYEQLVGPIPESHEIHHTCLNKLCINPKHLKSMTHKDHMYHHYRKF